MHPREDDVIEGVLESVVYSNPSNGYTVVRMFGRAGSFTAVGSLGEVFVGEELRLVGRWNDDRKWGRQFKVRAFSRQLPTSREGIRRYLASGLIKGVGEKLADRIVDRFGTQALAVIEQSPERLAEVPDLGPKRRMAIVQSFAAQRGLREVCMFLGEHGVGLGTARRVFQFYGERSLAVLQTSPYRLVRDVPGIGFRTADSIARRLGLAADSPERVQAAALHVVGEAATQGNTFLPVSRVTVAVEALIGTTSTSCVEALERLAETGALVLDPAPDEQHVYLPYLHRSERGAARRLVSLLASRPALDTARVRAALAAQQARMGLTLHEAQVEAVMGLAASNVVVITGGPGTGKTTIMRVLLEILESAGLRVALAAPTGRAAKRLEEATGHGAQTVHRLLKFQPKGHTFGVNEDHPLEEHALIIDEVSMVDIVLFNAIVRALPAKAQLVLVGDADQLPSVGAGNVLKDLIGSGVLPVFRLTHIFRQDTRGYIVANAHRINQGKLPRIPPESTGTASDFYFFERDDAAELARTVVDLVATRIPRSFGLDPRRDIQVLVPMYRGEAGVDALNAKLRERLNPHGEPVGFGPEGLRVGDKVLQLANDYDRGVYNGDIGCIVAVDRGAKTAIVDHDGREVPYGPADLEHVTLAYAVSVHKAQGSEYPAVVIPVSTQHYLLLQRNLLYTAVTRARRLVVLVGKWRAVELAVGNDAVQTRFSGLAARLVEATKAPSPASTKPPATALRPGRRPSPDDPAAPDHPGGPETTRDPEEMGEPEP